MKTLIMALLTASLTLAFVPCGTADTTKPSTEVSDAIALLKSTDPTIQPHFDNAIAYVVFPSVVKGAIGIGAAHGKGEVFERGARIGLSELTMGTMGAQLGGQKYIEVVFFNTQKALDDFKTGKFTMAAQASAVAAASGASADAKYDHGVMVVTLAKGGLMFEASVGGQKFTFVPELQTASR